MHQELLILFWRICDINKKFMYYVLKSSRVLDVLVPILYYLNKARNDKCKWVLPSTFIERLLANLLSFSYGIRYTFYLFPIVSVRFRFGKENVYAHLTMFR